MQCLGSHTNYSSAWKNTLPCRIIYSVSYFWSPLLTRLAAPYHSSCSVLLISHSFRGNTFFRSRIQSKVNGPGIYYWYFLCHESWILPYLFTLQTIYRGILHIMCNPSIQILQIDLLIGLHLNIRYCHKTSSTCSYLKILNQ